MKKINKIRAFAISLLLLALPSVCLAADDTTQLIQYVEQYYEKLILPAGTILAGFVMIYAGIIYASSEGEPNKIALAKEYLIGAISGLALLIAAATIINTIIK